MWLLLCLCVVYILLWSVVLYFITFFSVFANADVGKGIFLFSFIIQNFQILHSVQLAYFKLEYILDMTIKQAVVVI